MNTSICRSCGAKLVYIQTASGKQLPCDAYPGYYTTKAGNSDRVVTKNGAVLSCEIVAKPENADGIGYRPHWSTCDNPNRFRKRKQAKP